MPAAPSTPPMHVVGHPQTPPSPTHGVFLERRHLGPRSSSPSAFKSLEFSDVDSTVDSPVSAGPLPPARGQVTDKRTRTAHLASPPSSPARRVPLSTPRRAATRTMIPACTTAEIEQTASLAPASANDVPHMMPTPSKTPSKKAARRTTSRILNFQPENVNDSMPKPRKMPASSSHRAAAASGFELDGETDAKQRHSQDIEIFTDANARVPAMDHDEDNPFVSSIAKENPPRRRSKRITKSKEELEEEAVMAVAVTRGDGMIYSYRGKKIFRPYSDATPTAEVDSLRQRHLRRSATGSSEWDRPLTRSQLQPRRLNFESTHLQTINDDRKVGSEDETDIDDTNTHVSQSELRAISPPHLEESTLESDDKARNVPRQSAINSNADRSGHASNASPPAQSNGSTRGNNPSPFDSWQRTKPSSRFSASNRNKRTAETMEGSSLGLVSKRTRSSERAG